jgi:hypothetical protein
MWLVCRSPIGQLSDHKGQPQAAASLPSISNLRIESHVSLDSIYRAFGQVVAYYGIRRINCNFGTSILYASRDNQPIGFLDLKKYYPFS